MTKTAQADNAVRALVKRRRLFMIVLLVVAVIVEGYYIHLLQDRIEKQTDELKNITVRLLLLKSEEEDLKARLSAAQKTEGDPGSGNTTER